jgi:hypothetical protein
MHQMLWIDQLGQDVRYGFTLLLRDRGFTVVAALALASASPPRPVSSPSSTLSSCEGSRSLIPIVWWRLRCAIREIGSSASAIQTSTTGSAPRAASRL